MKKLAFLFCIMTAFMACKEKDKPSPISIPFYSKEFDVDADGRNDINITFTEFVMPAGSVAERKMSGSVSPLNSIGETKLLHVGNVGYLFLKPNDSIYVDNYPLTRFWNWEGGELLSKEKKANVWDKEWKVISPLASNYKLGIKMTRNNVTSIGYVNLEIDTKTGDIKVKNAIISANNTLLVQ